MTDDINSEEDALSPVLHDAARSYNEPPVDVPREAMWEVIARARAGVVGSLPAGATPAKPGALIWRMPRVVQWAAAAALLLSAGYLAGRRATPEISPSGIPASSDRREASLADAVAATQHFAHAEVALTQFRNDVTASRTDAAAAEWARQLLLETRLFLDSPAASDPTRRALLQDIELMLVQILRSSRVNDAEDRKLTSDALRESGLLDRLRAVVPSGTRSTS